MRAGKASGSPTPHDAAFKQFLTHPATARDFIRLHLPAELLAACDLSTLKLESGSFVEASLRCCFSDVLYSMKTLGGGAYVYVLIEHQSTPDKHMAFRLLRYAVAAMQRHLDAGHKTLPLVIPLLFYTGRRSPYPYSTRWLDEFADPALAAKLYGGSFPLVDVTTISDEEIMTHRRMAALTLLQKHIHQRDLTALLDRLAMLIMAEEMTGQQLISLINYLAQSGGVPDPEAFVSRLAQQVPKYRDELMTIAEHFEQKGIKKGILIGEQRGLEKGEREATRKIARAMLHNGLDYYAVSLMTGLSEAELAELNH